ncbi:uncharacterized protein [Typha angustifolia]|uniref:uncharacterized protein n=1 Tax=Typha angustifolia TaxID=59011 RepID=UPI003C2CDDEA
MGVSYSCGGFDDQTFKWRIDGFSHLLRHGNVQTKSRPFKLAGFEWCLIVNPMAQAHYVGKEFVSLAIHLDARSMKSDCVVEAVFKLVLYDQLSRKHIINEVSHQFQTTSLASRTTYVISLEKLKSSSEFLVNDSCVFGAKLINFNRLRLLTVSESLSVQKEITNVYTWNVSYLQLSEKKICHSKFFSTDRYRWYLILKTSGPQDSDFISLDLALRNPDCIPVASGLLVDFTLCIKDKKNGYHKKFSAREHFDRKTAIWGWLQFISQANIRMPSNGFLVDSKCTIEATVTILGLYNRNR